jgi:hypothetical protein
MTYARNLAPSLLLALSLAACSDGASPPSPPQSTPSGGLDTTAGDAAASAAATAPASGTTVASAPAMTTPPPPALRPVKVEPTPRPTADEWAAAPAVNTAPAERHPRGCTLQALRDWVRASCKGEYFSPDSDWGAAGKDYFTVSDAVEIRLAPGKLVQGKAGFVHAVLLVVWPSYAETPAITSLTTPLPTGQREPLPPNVALPPVPRERGPRPPEADWLVAPSVNFGPEAGKTKNCVLRVSGTWARLKCRQPEGAVIDSWESWSGFGDKDRDHFLGSAGVFRDSVLLDFVLAPGGNAGGRLAFSAGNHGRVRLQFRWPEGAPQPTVLSVEETYP